jgi:prepilin-type processing-associated H-X9-DG protein
MRRSCLLRQMIEVSDSIQCLGGDGTYILYYQWPGYDEVANIPNYTQRLLQLESRRHAGRWNTVFCDGHENRGRGRLHCVYPERPLREVSMLWNFDNESHDQMFP